MAPPPARAGSTASSTDTSFDSIGRLHGLTQGFAGTSADLTAAFAYSPTNQLASLNLSNDAYSYHLGARSQGTTPNGLNQAGNQRATTYGYDAAGTLNTSTYGSTTTSYGYDSDNRLLSASGPTAVSLSYDPLGRLQTSATSSAATTFLYDGDFLAGEYDSAGNILNRYVPGPGQDEPVTWYAGAGTSTRQWPRADAQGSIIGWSDSTNTSGAIQAYDPYGNPASWSGGPRYAYTGQIAIPEAQLYFYKARVYSPVLGRFLQTDPAGYASDLNLYAYAGGDPINNIDPSGLDFCDEEDTFVPDGQGGYFQVGDLVYCGSGASQGPGFDGGGGPGGTGVGGSGQKGGGKPDKGTTVSEVVVTGTRRCGALSILPHGIGVSVGGEAEAGLPLVAGAGGAIGLGGGILNSDKAGASLGGFIYKGASAYAGHASTGIQPNLSQPGIGGASIGVGVSIFLTNAQSSQQLAGPFKTTSLNIGIGPFKASGSISLGGGIWHITFGPPITGVTAGLSGSQMTTTTENTSGCFQDWHIRV